MEKGYYLVFSTAVISGFAIFINRFGVEVLNPYIFTWLKNIVPALLLTGLLFILKDWQLLKGLSKKQWLLLVIIGLVGGSIPFLLFFKGLSLTSAAQGAFVHKTMFIYVAFLAAVFLKEKVNKGFLLGGLFLLIGNLLALKKLSLSINQGDILILLATLFWAVENTISKHILKELPGRIVGWARMFFGVLFIFVFLLFTGQTALLPQLTLVQIAWALATGIILFGYVMTWYSGLRYVPVSKATVILLLGSPITTLLSFIWTGQITTRGIVACLFIVAGILLVLGLKKVWYLFRRIKNVYVRA